MSNIRGCAAPAVTARPKVSVVMAIRNEEKYGPSAIQSILDQTFSDFEFIIIDDASTDSTPHMLRSFARNDSRIRTITNAENLGVTRSLNVGLKAVRGDYIARMDADDYTFPHRFADQIEFLDANPDFIVVGGGAQYIDADGHAISTFDRGSTWWEFEWVSFFRPPLIHPCAMFRANAVQKFQLFYDHRLHRAQDFEYWHRILRHGKGSELPGVYFQYRIHDRNVSTVFSDAQRDAANRAGKKNAKNRFSEIAPNDIDAVFDFLHPTTHSTSIDLQRALHTIAAMQSIFAKEKRLSAAQIRDIQRKTAKLLIKNALLHGMHRRIADMPELISLVLTYLPDYCAEATAIARHKLRPSIAA